jgi:hypothetical protein
MFLPKFLMLKWESAIFHYLRNIQKIEKRPDSIIAARPYVH